jgi:hypothetical protein
MPFDVGLCETTDIEIGWSRVDVAPEPEKRNSSLPLPYDAESQRRLPGQSSCKLRLCANRLRRSFALPTIIIALPLFIGLTMFSQYPSLVSAVSPIGDGGL